MTRGQPIMTRVVASSQAKKRSSSGLYRMARGPTKQSSLALGNRETDRPLACSWWPGTASTLRQQQHQQQQARRHGWYAGPFALPWEYPALSSAILAQYLGFTGQKYTNLVSIVVEIFTLRSSSGPMYTYGQEEISSSTSHITCRPREKLKTSDRESIPSSGWSRSPLFRSSFIPRSIPADTTIRDARNDTPTTHPGPGIIMHLRIHRHLNSSRRNLLFGKSRRDRSSDAAVFTRATAIGSPILERHRTSFALSQDVATYPEVPGVLLGRQVASNVVDTSFTSSLASTRKVRRATRLRLPVNRYRWALPDGPRDSNP